LVPIPHRLLLVDGDPPTQERWAGLLARPGRLVETASDASSAIQRLRAFHFDLVVAGPSQDGTDELDLLDCLRAARPGTKVIVAGRQDPQRVLEAMRGHAYSYFHQPISENAFADMVERAIEAASWESDIRLISAIPEWIAMEVRCTLEAAERTVQFVREAESTLPGGVWEDVSCAFRELLLNAVEHGGGLDPRNRVRTALIRTAGALVVHIHDAGPGFSANLLPHAAISNPGDSPTRHAEVRAEQGQRPGGFGILMCRHLVDELLYDERGNQVVFVKYLK
jgi:DNA-binding NarL/FixJ family response regulator